MWNGKWILALALVLAVPALSSCSTPPASSCVPRMFVDSLHVSPGGTITVTSDTTCDVPTPEGGWVVGARAVGPGSTSLVSVTSEDQFDGSFTVQLTIPDDFPIGEGYAIVENWNYSSCLDANSSCAVASATFYVDP